MTTTTNPMTVALSILMANLRAATKVYLGPTDGCRCGCHGSYAEKGTRAFDIRIKRFRKWVDDPATKMDFGGNYADASLDGRSICVYFD